MNSITSPETNPIPSDNPSTVETPGEEINNPANPINHAPVDKSINHNILD